MRNRLNLMAGVAALFAVVPGPSLAQSIDESFYYKLSTDFRGDGMKLDVFNGGPKNNRTRLEPDQDVSGQFWRLVTALIGCRPSSAAKTCAWTSSTAVQTTTSPT